MDRYDQLIPSDLFYAHGCQAVWNINEFPAGVSLSKKLTFSPALDESERVPGFKVNKWQCHTPSQEAHTVS